MRLVLLLLGCVALGACAIGLPDRAPPAVEDAAGAG